MLRAELAELQFIAHQNNLGSILAYGILCFNAARKLPHVSVAMSAVQELRDKVQVPRGRRLHDYANLYFHARNPMMYLRRELHAKLCVLRVDTAVLDVPGAVIADSNASSGWTGFWPSPSGLSKVDRDATFAEDWTDVDKITYWRKKSAKCAEVLVPQRVDVALIRGVYVSCAASAAAVKALGLPWPVSVDAHLFFQS